MVPVEQMRATEEWRRHVKRLKINDLGDRRNFLKRYLNYNKTEIMNNLGNSNAMHDVRKKQE